MKRLIAAIIFGLVLGQMPQAQAAPSDAKPLLQGWYKLIILLVRHTPNYSPPVASRSFAYLGVTAYESIASGSDQMQTLAGQLQGLKSLPKREVGKTYDDRLVVDAAMTFAAHHFFGNTGPTGQRAMLALEVKLHKDTGAQVPADVAKRSEAFGRAMAAAIFAWSQNDGGATIHNMGFPETYKLNAAPGHWVPTSTIRMQQAPLLPTWANNRPFAMPAGNTCALPAPPEYSEEQNSEFYKQAMETYLAVKNGTAEHRTIARFWSDDPMLSPTPPGHWVSIIWQISEHDNISLEKTVESLARVGVAEADAFIGCWNTKFQYDLVRPVTYIRKLIDPKWEPLLITPPFPEYPSGHSTNSGAAAVVLASMFGEHYAFEDQTPEGDGIAPRKFASFWAAAEEAGISRQYGGIHFRAAIERGLSQGRCIAAFATALKMGK